MSTVTTLLTGEFRIHMLCYVAMEVLWMMICMFASPCKAFEKFLSYVCTLVVPDYA